MRQKSRSPEDNDTTRDHWEPLYRAGAVAPLVTMATYVVEVVGVLLVGDNYPTKALDWFSLFADRRLLGLLALNVFDVISIALLGVMFVALYIVLRQWSQSIMLIALFFALLGITVFVASRADMGSTMLKLSDQYAAAATRPQRDQLLAVAQALAVSVRATIDTMGFFFVAAASLLISIVILRSKAFDRATAYVGIFGFIVTLVSRVSLVTGASLSGALMPVNGLAWLIWWVLVSRSLFRLSNQRSKKPIG